MPITPLHIGVLAPISHFAPGKVSAVSFILTQLLLDGETIKFYLFNYGAVDHSGHNFYTALVLAAAIGLAGFWSARWVWGAFVGTFSHVLLDALVHTDVELLAPWIQGNRMYFGAMEPLSLILLALSAWWLLQLTSTVLGRFFRSRPGAQAAVALPVADRFLLPSFARQWRWHLGRATCLLVILMLPFMSFVG